MLSEEVKESTDKFSQESIYFTDIPKLKSVAGMKAEEVTKANFDKSKILTDLLNIEWNKDYKKLFGELQFAFVGFMLGENMICFEHWKKLISLLCSSEDACKNCTDLYLDFIGIFALTRRSFVIRATQTIA